MTINRFLSDALSLLNKVPEPLVDAAIDLAKTVFRSLADKDTPEETLRKAREELVKLENVQRAYHARAQQKFPGYEP